MAKQNPFEKIDAAVNSQCVQDIVAVVSDMAFRFGQIWNSLTPEQREQITAAAQDIGSKLITKGMTAMMTGASTEEMGEVIKDYLSQSTVVSQIVTGILKARNG